MPTFTQQIVMDYIAREIERLEREVYDVALDVSTLQTRYNVAKARLDNRRAKLHELRKIWGE